MLILLVKSNTHANIRIWIEYYIDTNPFRFKVYTRKGKWENGFLYIFFGQFTVLLSPHQFQVVLVPRRATKSTGSNDGGLTCPSQLSASQNFKPCHKT